MGKSTISTGPFSIAMLVYQRVPKCATELVEISFPTDGAFCCISVKLASLDSAGRCAIHGFSWRNSHEKNPVTCDKGAIKKWRLNMGSFLPHANGVAPCIVTIVVGQNDQTASIRLRHSSTLMIFGGFPVTGASDIGIEQNSIRLSVKYPYPTW